MGQGPNPEPPALSPSLARWGAPLAQHLLSPRLPAPHRQGASRPLSASDQGPQKAVGLAGAGWGQAPAETPARRPKAPQTSAGETSNSGLEMTVEFKMMFPRK